MLGLLLISATPAISAQKGRTPQARITGTVFQPSGHSLPGARVMAWDESHPEKKFRARTDRRGEFVIRVPAGKARYQVQAQAKGFGTEQKAVEIYADEKVSTNFVLQAEQDGVEQKE